MGGLSRDPASWDLGLFIHLGQLRGPPPPPPLGGQLWVFISSVIKMWPVLFHTPPSHRSKFTIFMYSKLNLSSTPRSHFRSITSPVDEWREGEREAIILSLEGSGITPET